MTPISVVRPCTTWDYNVSHYQIHRAALKQARQVALKEGQQLTESLVRRNSWSEIVTFCSNIFLSAFGSRGRWPLMFAWAGVQFELGGLSVEGEQVSAEFSLGGRGADLWAFHGENHAKT